MKRFARAALGGIFAVGVLATVPSAVFAAQPACGDTLVADTTLTADLDCSAYAGIGLTFGKNRVVLDLNGHTIIGPSGGHDGLHGVHTDRYNRVVIKNGTIANYSYGVFVDESHRSKVRNLDIVGEDDGADYGILIEYGVGNVVRDVDVSNMYRGLYATFGANLTVRDSTFMGSNSGIYLYEETADTLFNNDFWGGMYSAYEYLSHRNVYTDNTANDGYYGFYMDCDSYGIVTMTDNIANGNDEHGFYINSCYGPNYNSGVGSRFLRNTANDNGHGFYSDYSFNEIWKKNTANDNDGDGFFFEQPTEAVITYNVARRNGDTGIEVVNNFSYYNVNTLSYNTANGNDYGLYASFGAPGTGNIARKNTTMNCYNARCGN